jgi:hypothetical protein
MKAILPLAILVVSVAGCNLFFPPKAPAMKRVVNYELIDEHYLKDVFVPNYTGSKLQLSNSVSQLEIHLDEFRDFMRQVETGKIPVTQGMKGDWASFTETKDYWISATYWGRDGLVIDFQKHKKPDPYPMIYAFRISTNGYIFFAESFAESMHYQFEFDEHGKVQRYWHSHK